MSSAGGQYASILSSLRAYAVGPLVSRATAVRLCYAGGGFLLYTLVTIQTDTGAAGILVSVVGVLLVLLGAQEFVPEPYRWARAVVRLWALALGVYLCYVLIGLFLVIRSFQ
ncbi:hypothetical protein B1756_04450 [Natrarchaeobaculum aegyptiacum]|uniref:Uncharacterized protein n=1 Tax=Natrarchaeobaculum aegyptiacum TaxID=745377 RepID=A0A2Z2HPU6_9EURY|nr:hypothetical protein B1756_04450 [Natrarchaeobaculum aegyptiacum]